MAPLKITEHLTILMREGKPLLKSAYGYNPIQVEEEIRRWQERGHPRLPDSELWLEAYQPQIEGYKERLEQAHFQDFLQELFQKKKENAKKEIEHARKKYRRSSELVHRFENFNAALLLVEVRGIVKELGHGDEEAQNRAVVLVGELLQDLGYSEEESDSKIGAVLNVAAVVDPPSFFHGSQ